MAFQKQLTPENAVVAQDEAISDSTRATDIVAFGKVGTRVVKDVNDMKLEADIQQEMDNFEAARVAADRIPGVTEDLANRTAQSQALEAFGDDEDPALKRISAELVQLKNRVGAGATTQGELKIRMATAVKRAVNRLPGFSSEIRELGRVLVGENISFLKNLEEDRAERGLDGTNDSALKMEEKRKATYRARGKELGVIQQSNMPWQVFESIVDEKNFTAATLQALERDGELGLQKLVRDPNAARILAAKPTEIYNKIALQAEEAKAKGLLTQENAPVWARNMLDQHLADFQTMYATVWTDQTVKDTYDRILDGREDYVKMYSGELEFLSFQQRDRMRELRQLSKIYNDPTLGPITQSLWYFEKFFPPTVIENFYNTGPGVVKLAEVWDLAGQIQQGTKLGYVKPEVAQTIFDATAEVFPQVTKDDGSPDYQARMTASVNTISGTLEGLLDGKKPPTSESVMAYARMASMPEFKELLKYDVSGNLARQSGKVLDKYNTHMYGAAGEGGKGGVVGRLWDSNVMEARVVGGRIDFKMKDGLSPGGEHQANLMELISKHSTDINHLAHTAANVRGITPQQALEDLAKQFNLWNVEGKEPEKPSFWGAVGDQFSQVGRDMEANIRATGADPASQTPSAFTRKKVTKQPDGSFTIQEGEQRSPF
jgi:hypothetical protein